MAKKKVGLSPELKTQRKNLRGKPDATAYRVYGEALKEYGADKGDDDLVNLGRTWSWMGKHCRRPWRIPSGDNPTVWRWCSQPSVSPDSNDGWSDFVEDGIIHLMNRYIPSHALGDEPFYFADYSSEDKAIEALSKAFQQFEELLEDWKRGH